MGHQETQAAAWMQRYVDAGEQVGVLHFAGRTKGQHVPKEASAAAAAAAAAAAGLAMPTYCRLIDGASRDAGSSLDAKVRGCC